MKPGDQGLVASLHTLILLENAEQYTSILIKPLYKISS